MLTETEKLKNRLAREKLARQNAEDLLEKKAMELYEKNQQLLALTDNLEKKVAKRTSEMQHARDEAIRASKIKSDFIANISHELRTPMNGVLGILSILAEEDLTDEQIDLLKTARASGEHLLLLINDVLDFTKIEENKLELSFEPVNIKELLTVICKPFEIQASQKNIQINLNLSQNIPNTIVSDKLRLTQIVTNLLSNAVKFTKKGQIDVVLECLQIKNNRGNFRLTVKDTGIGISAQHMKSVFAAFEQADSSITRDFGGTGLGMNITKRLVDKFGGEIHLSSKVGEGTTFSIDFSFEICVQNNVVQREVAQFDQSRDNNKVLLVEDNKINQMVAEKMLTKMGIDLTIAENGKEAIDILVSNTFDLVFMDLQMPVMGGIDATKEIRSRGLISSDTPIVAMTAHNTKSHIDECLDVGMQGHISKPIENDKLIAILNQYLTVEVKQTKAETAELVTNIYGIDINDGLKRLHGDWDLYYSLIERFLMENEGAATTLRALNLTKNANQAREVVHRIKGTTANLGIMNISEIAANMENGLREANTIFPTDTQLDELECELRKTFESFKEIDNPNEISNKADIRTESKDYILQKMDSILDNLSKDILASEESLKDLMHCELSENTQNLVKEANTSMSLFDIDAVSKLINQAKNTLV